MTTNVAVSSRWIRMLIPTLMTEVSSCFDDKRSSPTASRACTSEIKLASTAFVDEYQTCFAVLTNVPSRQCPNKNTSLTPTCDSTTKAVSIIFQCKCIQLQVNKICFKETICVK